MARPRHRDDFRIAIICALPLEAEMVQLLFDKDWAEDNIDLGQAEGDQNVYSLGEMGKHNVVLTYMPGIGSTSAAGVATGLRLSYNRIEVAFVTGICGVAPIHPVTKKEILLGDCIISTTMVQYDFGRQYPGSLVRKTEPEDTLGRASPNIRALVASLQTGPNLKRLSLKLVQYLEVLQNETVLARYPGAAKDHLYGELYLHTHHRGGERCNECISGIDICSKDCEALECDDAKLVERSRLIGGSAMSKPQLHFGRYGSSNSVLRSGKDRERLVVSEGIVAFEMEGAGVWENLPTILVKSARDYADSHKSKEWQSYAAATAASALKSILDTMVRVDSKQSGSTLQVAFNVPKLAVTSFVKRTSLLKELDDWMHDEANCERLVLLGMGGAGKSQLALECCKRAELYGFTTCFWINASSEFSAQQSLKLIILGLQGTHPASSNWRDDLNTLSEILLQRGGRWLAVLDNFDSPASFKHDLITSYIPTVGKGKALFTSRDGSCERLGSVLRVSEMTKQESLDLLLKRPVHNSREREIGLQIAAELGYLALALDQAEAYIRARNLPLENFIKHFMERKALVLKEIPLQWEYRRSEAGTEKSTLLSAFITWELSFSQVIGSRRIKRYKKHFLTLCAYFDRTSVTKEYFKTYFSVARRDWMSLFSRGNTFDEYVFDDVVAEFRRLSLLQNDDDHGHEAILSFHTLIREWLKLRRTIQEQQNMAKELTDLLVWHISGTKAWSLSYVIRQRLLANIVSCMKEDKRFEDTSANFPSREAVVFALVPFTNGMYREAEQLFLKALKAHDSTSSFDSSMLASIHTKLGIGYTRQGLNSMGEKSLKQALALELNAGNEFTARTHLAIHLKNTRKHDEFEELLKTVPVCSTKLLGCKDRETMRAATAFAILRSENGGYEKAEKQLRQLLNDQKDLLGHEHPDTLSTMLNLGILYMRHGDTDQAIRLIEQGLINYEKIFGPDHPNRLEAIERLSILYLTKQKYHMAEAMLEEVLERREKTKGSLHADVLRVMYLLGVVYQDQGRLDQAEEVLFKVLVYSHTRRLEIPYSSLIPPSLALIAEKRGTPNRHWALIEESIDTHGRLLHVTIWNDSKKQSSLGSTQESDSSLSYVYLLVPVSDTQDMIMYPNPDGWSRIVERNRDESSQG